MSTPSNDGDNNTSNATNNSGSSTIRNNSSNRQTIHDERDFKQTPMFVVEKPSGQEGVVLKTVIIILLAFIIENNTQFSIAALFFKIFSQPVWMLFGV